MHQLSDLTSNWSKNRRKSAYEDYVDWTENKKLEEDAAGDFFTELEHVYLQLVQEYAKLHCAKLVCEYTHPGGTEPNGYVSLGIHADTQQLVMTLKYPRIRTPEDFAVFLHELGHLFDDGWAQLIPAACDVRTRKITQWTTVPYIKERVHTRGTSYDILCQEIAASRYAYQQLVRLGLDLTRPMGYLEKAYGTYTSLHGPCCGYEGKNVPKWEYVYQYEALERQELYVWKDSAAARSTGLGQRNSSSVPSGTRLHPHLGGEPSPSRGDG